MTKFEEIKTIFGFGKIQDAANIMRIMLEKSITLSDFISWVDKAVEKAKLEHAEAGKQVEEIQRLIKYHARRCPQCGDILAISRVNNLPGNQVGGNFKCAWQCRALKNCGYEVYSEKSLEDELKAYNEEFYNTIQRLRARIRS